MNNPARGRDPKLWLELPALLDNRSESQTTLRLEFVASNSQTILYAVVNFRCAVLGLEERENPIQNLFEQQS